MSMVALFVEAGEMLNELAGELREWSEATFGSDKERGPLGALKHLELEAREAQDAPGDPEEYADCFLLILDASRRAGIKPMQLMEHAKAKLEVNKRRQWPKPTSETEPVEHVPGT